MIRPNIRIMALGTMVLILLAGCASTGPDYRKIEPNPDPIRVAGETMPAVTFVKVITDIPGGRVIGYEYEGMENLRRDAFTWDEHFEDETRVLNDVALESLQEAGYMVAVDDPAALQLIGTMGQLKYNSYIRKISFDQAECDMTWDLYRPGESRPYFSTVTPGEGRVDTGQPGSIIAAFKAALARLLADDAFVAAVEEGS